MPNVKAVPSNCCQSILACWACLLMRLPQASTPSALEGKPPLLPEPLFPDPLSLDDPPQPVNPKAATAPIDLRNCRRPCSLLLLSLNMAHFEFECTYI